MLPYTLVSSAVFLSCISAYKLVIFVPCVAKSQVVFNIRVADTLSKAGHDVTMVMLQVLDEDDTKIVKVPPKIQTYYLNGSSGVKMKDFEEEQQEFIYQDLPIWDYRLRRTMNRATSLFINSCRKILENKEFLEWLADQKFDLAFSYVMNACPIGVIHHAKIPTWIWLNSAALMEFVAYHMGVPIIPSYVPPNNIRLHQEQSVEAALRMPQDMNLAMVMESTDTMNFLERTKSVIGHMLMIPIWKWIVTDKETALFRELIDPDFPDLLELAKQCPLVMVNSNELYDYPRPTLAKIVNIGGIGAQLKDARPLAPEYQRIVDAGKGFIVFSFGSITPSEKMPLAWKMAFIEAFKRFHDYHFIWRYVGADLQGKLPSNVHTFEWLPQSDLLQHPNAKAFITHGGYNSMQEAISAGVPLIAIPLFGDQPKNARLAEHRGFAVRISKNNIKAESIAEALTKILNDQSYTMVIKRISNMVKKKPVSVSHLLVSWTEFVAEFKTLENLVPAGNKLNFVQYHSIDVIATIMACTVVFIYVLWRLLIFVAFKVVALANIKKLKKE